MFFARGRKHHVLIHYKKGWSIVKTHLKRLAVIPAAACLLASLPVGAFAAGSNTLTVEVNAKFNQTEARTQFDMINNFRTSSTDAWYLNKDGSTYKATGLQELRYNYALEKLAMQRAMENVLYWDHERANSEYLDTIYEDFGYVDLMVAGENIAYASYLDPARTFENLQETEEDYSGQGHRRNMLDDEFTDVGIACVTYKGKNFWVQAFATPTDNADWVEYTEQPAVDSETTYDIEVDKKHITGYTISTETADFSLDVDGTAELPSDLELYATVYNTGFTSDKNKFYADHKVKDKDVDFTYTADSNIITIDGDTITANEAGTANITVSAEVDGETLATKKIPVTVTEKEAPAPTVTGISYTADGNLIANVYVDIDEELVEKGVMGTIEHYFSSDDADGLSVKAIDVPYVEGQGYKFSFPLNAPDINDELRFKLELPSENYIEFIVDGEKSTEYSFTAKDYAEKAAGLNNKELDTLVDAIINYGNAAENLFDNTSEPVTVTQHTTKEFEKYKPNVTGTAPEGFKIEGTSLVLNSATTLKVYFTAPEGFDIETISVDNETDIDINCSDKEKNLYSVSISNIAPANLDKTYTINFGDGYSLDISCLTYAYKLFDKYGEAPEYKPLCTAVNALVDYYEAAKAYFQQ